MRERETSVLKGKVRLRKFLSRRYKRRHRIHPNAFEIADHHLRALYSQCGSCSDVKVIDKRVDGKRLAKVECRKGHDVFLLYENTPIGQEPDCSDYTPRR